jgi:DNA repair protein RadA/Sms
MAKTKTAYVCTECGASALQWFGSCPSCATAGTLVETITERGFVRQGKSSVDSVSLGDIATKELERIPTGLAELDRAQGWSAAR